MVHIQKIIYKNWWKFSYKFYVLFMCTIDQMHVLSRKIIFLVFCIMCLANGFRIFIRIYCCKNVLRYVLYIVLNTICDRTVSSNAHCNRVFRIRFYFGTFTKFIARSFIFMYSFYTTI